MDQTIGIGYQVDGVSQVVKANADVIASFDKVAGKLTAVGASITTAAAPIMAFAQALSMLGNASASIKDLGVKGAKLGDFFKGSRSLKTAAHNAETFNKAITDTPTKASAAAAAINSLAAAVEQLNHANGNSKNYKPDFKEYKNAPFYETQGGGGGKRRQGKQTGNFLMDSIWGKAPWFLLRYRMWSAGIQAAQYAGTDLLLGRSRQKMAHGLGELSPLGFDQNLKKDTEFAAKMFSQKFWTVSAESYIQAMSQTASAFDVSAIGFGNMQKMNEASMKVSMISKMSAEKTSELMTKTLLGFMNQLPTEITSQLQKGMKADVKGYGNVDIGGLAQGMAAQIGKTIAVSSIWGPGIQSAFRYILPSVLERGWSLPSSLALVGSIADIGFQPGQGGRGAKDLFEGEGDPMAQMLMRQTGLWRDTKGLNLSADEKKLNKDHNTQYTKAIRQVVNKWMADEELAPELLKTIGKIYGNLEKEGFDIVKEFGVSKQWIPLFRGITKESFWVRFQNIKDKIANSVDSELTESVLMTLNDAGTAYERISTSFQNFSTSLADWPGAHAIAKTISKPLNFATTLMGTQQKVLRDGWDGEKIWTWWLENYAELTEQFGQEGTKAILDQMYKTKDTGKTAGWMKPTFKEFDKDFAVFMQEFNDFSRELLIETFGGTTKELMSLWDTGLSAPFIVSDDAQKALSEFWDSNVSQPLKSLGSIFSDNLIDPVTEGIAGVFKDISDGFAGFSGQVSKSFQELYDSVDTWVKGMMPKKIEAEPGSVPAPDGTQSVPWYERPALQMMSYGGGSGAGAPPQIILTSQIDNRLQLDSRVIAQVVAEIIQQNRDVHYHGYGGDPMGFVT